MNAKEAGVVLGLSLKGLSDNEINIAFARAVKLAHPDTGTGDVEGLDRAKKARDTLREFVAKGGAAPACGACGGTGYVVGRFGNKTCPRCNGAG